MNTFKIFVGSACVLMCLQSCKHSAARKIERPRDPWAFRSVLDKQPRMLTLALDPECYAAYDLAHCKLYKVWKGGVLLQGAAFTNKKNIQPTTWGTSYSDSLQTTWNAEVNGKKDSFHLVSRGYRFKDNQVYLKFGLVLSSKDTIGIEERPEFIQDEDGTPGFERQFTLSNVPSGITVSLNSGTGKFVLDANGTSQLVTRFAALPQQNPPSDDVTYDHKGRYWMEKSDCFTCHELDKNTVGPAFRAVANKYKNEEKPSSHLVPKIKQGGTGVWGSSVMNPHPNLTEEEIATMVDYILSLEPHENDEPVLATPKKKSTEKKYIQPNFGAALEGMHPSYTVQAIHKYNFQPRVGGLAFLPDGSLLVTTWDSVGAVYKMTGVETGDTSRITVKRIASGLAEPLGIQVVDGVIYVLQKQELTRLVDADEDGVIDDYQAVCNSWGATGDFHEFSFGLVYKDGYFYATLSMAMRLMSSEKELPDRGRTIRIGKDGSYERINYGLRTPNGIGLGVDNEVFVTDNQGEWVPANKLIHVKKGEYDGMRWGFLDSSSDVPPVAMPAIWLPENEIGNSPSEPVLIKDGPYKGQMLHGDVTFGGIQRDFLEKINGDYQGAAFRFAKGLEAGINRMRFGPDGALYIGGVGMVGGGWSWKEKQSGLQRMVYNGKRTFDMLAVRAKPNGFEIEFTEPIAAGREVVPADFLVQQWWYLPTANYGGPKKDFEEMKIKTATVSKDRKSVLLEIPGLKKQHEVYFSLSPDIKNDSGQSLWASEAWYTLNNIPE